MLKVEFSLKNYYFISSNALRLIFFNAYFFLLMLRRTLNTDAKLPVLSF
jgi:hypothetical protein